jgi:hypothetical protein
MAKVLYGRGWQEHDPTSPGVDRWWTRRALRSISSEHHIYGLYALEKTGAFWVGGPEADLNKIVPSTSKRCALLGGSHWANPSS